MFPTLRLFPYREVVNQTRTSCGYSLKTLSFSYSHWKFQTSNRSIDDPSILSIFPQRLRIYIGYGNLITSWKHQQLLWCLYRIWKLNSSMTISTVIMMLYAQFRGMNNKIAMSKFRLYQLPERHLKMAFCPMTWNGYFHPRK